MGITFVDCVLADVVWIECVSVNGLLCTDPRCDGPREFCDALAPPPALACGSRLMVELLITGYMRTWSAVPLVLPSW